MKKIFILTFSLLTYFGQAQEFNKIFIDSLFNDQLISFKSTNGYSSTSLNNAFINKFIYGGFIDSELINDNLGRNFNSVGGEFNQELTYYNGNLLKNKPELGLMFNISDINFISSNYSADLYETVFKGNTESIGDTLDFSFGHAQYLHYQNIGFGVFNKTTLSYIRLNFIIGHSSFNNQLGSTKLHLNETNETLFLKLNGEGFNTIDNSYMSANGYGASVELNHNFIFESQKGRKQIINFNLSNVGAIFWNKNTSYFQIDSNYSFSGIDFNDINNYSDYTMDDLQDTLGLNLGSRFRKESLPIHISIQKTPNQQAKEKWQYLFGFQAILIPDYRPKFYGGMYYKYNDKMSFSSKAIFGGFGLFKLGLNANFWIKNNTYLGIGTNDLIGIASNKFGFGKSVNFSFYTKF